MSREAGSVLMETLISMPLLIALVFGALQIAHIHIARQVVNYAAYAAVRAALPAENSKEEESARKAAQRILCWLTASADSVHDGVLMPDPESKTVKDRILEFKVNRKDWSREVELKFAFPLVMPLAAQIIAFQFNPSDFSKGETGDHISTRKFGDSFTGPHLVFHERAALPKPYQVKE
ncbi:MAG: pilus assembly protein [Lentisphaeria bacterium]|nr:pilus assembly protein [Lentisphaeria bacterium]